MFYEGMDSTSEEACASVDTSMSGEGSRDRVSLDVLQDEKESLLSSIRCSSSISKKQEKSGIDVSTLGRSTKKTILLHISY